MSGATTCRLVVGSWPGPSFATNDFVPLFCRALTDAGCEVVDVADPRRVTRPLDVLHIHWPEQLFWPGGGAARILARTATTLRALARLRARGVRLVWMVHNLRPHDRTPALRIAWRLIATVLPRLVHGAMTLSPATTAPVLRAFPALGAKPMGVVRQPAYDGSGAPERAAARAALGLPADATLFAMVGFLRPYKGAEDLIAAVRDLPRDGTRRHLLLAGSAIPAYGQMLRDLARDDRITVRPEPLDDEGLVAAIRAADCIVLPFRDYLHSGSMVHALCLGRPVISPHAPFADELAERVGAGWITRYDGPLSSDLLAGFTPPSGTPDISVFDAATVGAATRAFYQSLMAS